MRQIVLDTETTGLSVDDGHRIIEIGCVELFNRRLTGRHLHLFLNPDREIDAGAAAVHGITLDMLRDKPRFGDVVEEFLQFTAQSELIIHNASFDLGFLDEELRRVKRAAMRTHCDGVLDTLLLAREMHPGKRNSLDALCERYGVSNAHRKLHGALLDAELLADVYLTMTRGQESLEIGLHSGAGTGAGLAAEADWPPAGLRVLVPTDAECYAHEAQLKAIEKEARGPALWTRLTAVVDAPAGGA